MQIKKIEAPSVFVLRYADGGEFHSEPCTCLADALNQSPRRTRPSTAGFYWKTHRSSQQGAWVLCPSTAIDRAMREVQFNHQHQQCH